MSPKVPRDFGRGVYLLCRRALIRVTLVLAAGALREYSQLDVAPTMAKVLDIDLPHSDGKRIEMVDDWGCTNVVLVIIDSLGYDLYLWLRPQLECMPRLEVSGHLFRARAESTRTTPAIATILSGLLPEHHGILDKAGAKESSILSIPEIASSRGLKSAVIMEQNGADVYRGLIEFTGGIPDTIPPEEFDCEACRMTLQALEQSPRLVVSYFIGIDKAAHRGQGPQEIAKAAQRIDRCLGDIVRKAEAKTLFILCGDHPIHAGKLKRSGEPYSVALILGRKR